MVIGYRGAAAALLVALAAVGLAEARVAHNASSTEPVLTVALCAVLVGIAYYLGRTRPAPGMGQRLRLVTRIAPEPENARGQRAARRKSAAAGQRHEL